MVKKKEEQDIEQQLDEYFKRKFSKLEKSHKKKNVDSTHGTAGSLYFVGFVGALIYWWQAAIGFGAIVTGLLKAAVWPAYIVYNLLEMFYGIVA